MRAVLWRRTMPPEDAELADMRKARSRQTQMSDPPQPGPYWAIDTGPLRIVGIDTGVVGVDRRGAGGVAPPRLVRLRPPQDPRDREAADRERPPPARPDRQGHRRRGPRSRGRYVMAVGGDTHNYQRYPVKLSDGRTIQYVVSGGGGAYTHATHQIERVNVDGRHRGRSSSAIRCAATRWRASPSSTTSGSRVGARGWSLSPRPRRRPTSASCWT